jgi:hypothetical protein
MLQELPSQYHHIQSLLDLGVLVVVEMLLEHLEMKLPSFLIQLQVVVEVDKILQVVMEVLVAAARHRQVHLLQVAQDLEILDILDRPIKHLRLMDGVMMVAQEMVQHLGMVVVVEEEQ